MPIAQKLAIGFTALLIALFGIFASIQSGNEEPAKLGFIHKSGPVPFHEKSLTINPNLTASNCFDNPETEPEATKIGECGYPEPHNVGIPKNSSNTECAALTKWKPTYHELFEIPENDTIENKEIETTFGGGVYAEGSIYTGSKNLHLIKDCIIVKNTGNYAYPVVWLNSSSATGFLMENVTVKTVNPEPGGEAINEVVYSPAGATGIKIVKSRLEDCVECVNMSGEVSIEVLQSFLLANGHRGEGTTYHQEVFYGNESHEIIKESTAFNPENNTAIFFNNTVGPGNEGPSGRKCVSKTTIEKSFIAGANQEIQLCGKKGEGELVGTGKLVVKQTRFARCTTTPISSGTYKFCSGSGFEGADSHGYFALGGTQNIYSTELTSGEREESENFWDNNHAEVKSTE